MAPDDLGDEQWSRLMAAAQSGDAAAYERLLREVVPFVRAVASHYHRAPYLDEVVQDVLLTVHKVRHTYDPSRSLKRWLAMIARRRSIDMLRRRKRLDAHEIADAAAYETFVDPAANRHLERQVALDGLSEAVASLPPLQREAVELVKLREMSLAEASKLSGRSVAALKVNVHRAIKSLRKQMMESWRG